MVLIVVSMLSILTLAFFSTMQIEEQAANAFANTQRVKMVSQGAVSHGISILRKSIPEPALINESAGNSPGENWSVNPGRLTLFDDQGKVEYVDLHTGVAERDPSSTSYPDVHSVDLNEPLPGKEYPPIVLGDGSGDSSEIPPMRVQWVPLLENPKEAASEENPITARYGFWMDDESSKINFNVALGKPDRGTVDPQGFWQQYEIGMMPALFARESAGTAYSNGNYRAWALGQPRSVNLDILFDDPTDLDVENLMGHAWLRGFSRYPESILDFVDMPEDEREEWYHRNKYQLTFYSRAPEFNAFGRPRLFTTNIPLSLESGPLYQLPFVYNGPGTVETDYQIEGVLHMHSLMGTFGFTHRLGDDGLGLGNILAANVVNRAQLEMLRRYMGRVWPGQTSSLVDKYGEAECYQLAVSMIAMARNATTGVNTGDNQASSRDLGLRSTSVIYAPHGQERRGANPERHYWQIETEDPEGGGPKTIPMLPQIPGPHITEVRLTFQSEPYNGHPTQKRIKMRYEVEYYMNALGQLVYLHQFPTRVDYFRIDFQGGRANTLRPFYEMGPPDAESGKTRGDRNWLHNPTKNRVDPDTGEVLLGSNGNPLRVINLRGLGSLQLRAGRSVRLASAYHSSPHPTSPNRRIVRSPWRYLGRHHRYFANPDDPQPNNADRYAWVDSTTTDSLTFDVKWRLGQSIASGGARPRQMIPIGEDVEDTLEAQFTLDLIAGDSQTISWQINDPRLSVHKEEWIIDTEDGGTPGEVNVINGTQIEPDEFSSEKSKFRYFQRGPGRVRNPESPGRQFGLNRPDEFNSASRVSSKGFWSVLHTGIQNRVPWRTINLGGAETIEDPPDYLMMDILGATYPMQHDQWRINSTLPDEFSTVSFMNSTAGQVNLNSRIYPEENEYFKPPARRKPLEGVFAHLRSDSETDAVLKGIEEFQESDFFRYVGDLARVDGYKRSDSSATQFENEEYLRNMIGCLTTKSNTFGLWGAAQVVQKMKGNEEWGEFEDGDRVLGEKRFYALIERYVWPGKDGRPGNAHIDSTGKWDRIATQSQAVDDWTGANTNRLFQLPGSPPTRRGGGLDVSGTYPWYDGPQEVEMDQYVSRTLGNVKWTQSTLENAYNPPQPVIKYRVVYFKYLDE